MVPEGWRQCELGQLMSFKNGLNTDKINYGKGYKFVNVMDVFDNDIITEEKIIGRVDVTQKQLTENCLQYGDVLFNRTSETFDEIAMSAVYMDHAIATFGGFVIRGRLISDGIEPSFLVYALQSRNYREQVIKLGQGAVRANIGQKNLSQVALLHPPLPEQRKIAQILSTWDASITATEQLLENSQKRKKGLMQQLLTGKKRLPGFDGEWENIKLKSVLKEEKTRNRNNSVERVLSVTNHSGFVLPEEQFSKRVASNDVSNYKVVKRGQFGYNPSRLNVGSFARLEHHEIGLLSPMYVVFSVYKDRLDSDYFKAWMSSDETRQRVGSSTQGTVRDSVGFDVLCSFSFWLPPLHEQQTIAQILTAADQEIEALQQRLVCLKQEKKALMQQLLTGKKRVKLDEDNLNP